MKLFISILVLILNFQSFAKADDIRDFEIEGISIYDSLLDFVDINYINSDKEYLYKSKKYYTVEVRKDYEVFDSIQVAIKDKDKKYIIQSLAGKIYYRNNNIDECYELLNDIDSNISETLEDLITDRIVTGRRSHTFDKTGESTTDGVFFSLKNKSNLYVYCTDWSDKQNYTDNLKVQIRSNDYSNWLGTADD